MWCFIDAAIRDASSDFSLYFPFYFVACFISLDGLSLIGLAGSEFVCVCVDLGSAFRRPGCIVAAVVLMRVKSKSVYRYMCGYVCV